MLINDVMVNKVIFQICLSKKGAELVTDGGDGDWRLENLLVKFIIKGLGSSLNQDSSNRQRSSSLKEETTSRRVSVSTMVTIL